MPRGINTYDTGRLQGRNPANANILNVVSPGLVTEGLIFAMDAGNRASYSGSGSTWYDIQGTNNGAMTAGVSWVRDTTDTMRFNGTSGSVSPTDSGLLPRSGLTVHVWLKTSTADKWAIDKSNGGVSNGFCMIGSGAGNGYFFVNNTSLNTTATISTGAWINLVGTWQPSTYMGLYRNGTLNASRNTTVPAAINTQIANLQIGRRSNNNTDWWNGEIAQVLFYNRPLTATEVSQNFEATRRRFGV
jgi:hypothetical protein